MPTPLINGARKYVQLEPIFFVCVSTSVKYSLCKALIYCVLIVHLHFFLAPHVLEYLNQLANSTLSLFQLHCITHFNSGSESWESLSRESRNQIKRSSVVQNRSGVKSEGSGESESEPHKFDLSSQSESDFWWSFGA